MPGFLGRGWPILALLGSAVACDNGPAPTPPSAGLAITLAGVTLNPNNALSTRVAFEVHGADSVRLHYWAASEAERLTPFRPVTRALDTLVALGLTPGVVYEHEVEARSGSVAIVSDTMALAAGSLPAELQGITLQLTAPPPGGYILTGVAPSAGPGYAVAFDTTGQIRWYRGFDVGVGVGEIKQQPNGHITAFVGATFGYQPTYGRYEEVSPAGDLVRTYAAAPPYYTDNHELLLSFQDTLVTAAHFFGYDIRITDLTSIGGQPGVQLANHTVFRQTPAGSVQFFWNGWDHFTLADWIEEPAANKQLLNVDMAHPNSLAFDLDSNYIVSWRNLAEITKIDARTGAVIWRMGGAHNQFTFVNDPSNGFNGEHCVRVLDDGHLLLYDNGLRHSPVETRAVEYALDVPARTATLVWEFHHVPAIFTPFLGSVQRLASGNTLIGFGGVGRVSEVTPAGGVRWEGDLDVNGVVTPFYRAIRIAALEHYARP